MTTTHRPRSLDQDDSIWALVDLFRKESPADWRPRSIEFARNLGIFRGAGARWDVRFSVTAGRGEQFQVGVMILQEDRLVLSARRRLQLFEFLDVVEQKMRDRRFGGCFDIDRQDGRCAGYFRKSVRTTAGVRRELEALAALRFGKRARQQ